MPVLILVSFIRYYWLSWKQRFKCCIFLLFSPSFKKLFQVFCFDYGLYAVVKISLFVCLLLLDLFDNMFFSFLCIVSASIVYISFSLYSLLTSLPVKKDTFLLKLFSLLHVRQYLRISPLMNPLNVAVRWYDSLLRYWNVSVGLVCVLRSRMPLRLYLCPLNTSTLHQEMFILVVMFRM